MLTRKQRQDALDKLNKERIEKDYFTPNQDPGYRCPTCNILFYTLDGVVTCTYNHAQEENKMIENQAHTQKIDLLDRALEYSKTHQISLAEAQKEINDFLNPPTCEWTLLLDNEEYPCTLPKEHKGRHESGKMLKFDLKLEER